MKATLLRIALLTLFCFNSAADAQDDPPAINPFGKPNQPREDAFAGCVELSDGNLHPGKLYMTRDLRLKIYDEQLKRQREVPLGVVASIECAVQREWMEKEWRFKANADNEKVYTGRSYPVRQYTHTITLRDGARSPVRCQASSMSIPTAAARKSAACCINDRRATPVALWISSSTYRESNWVSPRCAWRRQERRTR